MSANFHIGGVIFYTKSISLSPPDAMLETIADVWGPGCSIQRFTIVEGIYHIIGFRPLPDGGQAQALWILDPKEETISIHPLLPILPGGGLMTDAPEVS